MLAFLITALHFSVSALSNTASSSGVEPTATMPMFSRFDLTVGSLSAVAVSMWIFSTIARDVSAMLERAKRASHVDPPASSYAIMRRAGPYRGEHAGPGKYVE